MPSNPRERENTTKVALSYINEEYRHNLRSLDAFVMVALIQEELRPTGSMHFGWVEADGEVSCHFDFRNKFTNERSVFWKQTLRPMEFTEGYQANVIGLKTLHLRGKIHRLFLDCKHVEFSSPSCYEMLVHNGTDYLRFLREPQT